MSIASQDTSNVLLLTIKAKSISLQNLRKILRHGWSLPGAVTVYRKNPFCSIFCRYPLKWRSLAILYQSPVWLGNTLTCSRNVWSLFPENSAQKQLRAGRKGLESTQITHEIFIRTGKMELHIHHITIFKVIMRLSSVRKPYSSAFASFVSLPTSRNRCFSFVLIFFSRTSQRIHETKNKTGSKQQKEMLYRLGRRPAW